MYFFGKKMVGVWSMKVTIIPLINIVCGWICLKNIQVIDNEAH
jgi:hypothetical protein